MLSFAFQFATAQPRFNTKIDSLKYELKNYNTTHFQLPDKTVSLADSVKVNLLNKIGLISDSIDKEKGVNYLNQGLLLASKIKFNKGIARSNLYLGIAYGKMGKHQLAITCLDKSITLSKSIGDEENLSNTYNELGIVFAKLGLYTEAVNNYLLAQNIFKKNNEIFHLASTYMNVGLIYKQQKRYEKALENYFKTLTIVKNEHNEDGDYTRAVVYCNIGQLYLKQGNTDQALSTLNKAKLFGAKFNDSYFNAEINRAIADCYSKLGAFKKAL
jgi:tetratricopeptide (TPR) repeat protein